ESPTACGSSLPPRHRSTDTRHAAASAAPALARCPPLRSSRTTITTARSEDRWPAAPLGPPPTAPAIPAGAGPATRRTPTPLAPDGSGPEDSPGPPDVTPSGHDWDAPSARSQAPRIWGWLALRYWASRDPETMYRSCG